MPASTLASRIEAVRRFSRFYTRRIGILEETLLHSPFTLPEGRLVYEIANREAPTAARPPPSALLSAVRPARSATGPMWRAIRRST